jgi:hypothetical protein
MIQIPIEFLKKMLRVKYTNYEQKCALNRSALEMLKNNNIVIDNQLFELFNFYELDLSEPGEINKVFLN